MKIVILKLGAIGDVLRTTVILPGLKQKYPDSDIYWITKKESYGILKDNPYLKEIILTNQDIPSQLKDIKFDIVISLDDDNGALDIIDSIDHDKIIGAYKKNNKPSYTKDSSSWFDMGLISQYGKKEADRLKAKNRKTYQEHLFSMVGLDIEVSKTILPILNLSKKDLEFATQFAVKNKINRTDLTIGVNTGAGGRWKDKKLSTDETIVLINTISQSIKCNIILFGGPLEQDRNNKIIKGVKTKIIDAGCNNSLMQFAALVNLCDVLVSSDSLALHVAVALKKKVVLFIYVTSPWEIELYGRGIKIIEKGKDLCSYKPKCDYPPDWDINEIVNAVNKLVKNS